MSQVGYYLIIIALGVLNVVLAAVAYWQRDKQIKGNRLREQQLRLAESRTSWPSSGSHTWSARPSC